MKLTYSRLALKDIDKIRDRHAVRGLVKALDLLEAADDLRTMSQVKALAGNGSYYRIRIGNYRLGFRQSDDGQGVLIMRMMHRREIYRHFPPV